MEHYETPVIYLRKCVHNIFIQPPPPPPNHPSLTLWLNCFLLRKHNGYHHYEARWPASHASEPFHSQEWSMSNFHCSLTRNITSLSMKNLAFHSLRRWKMMILEIFTTLLIHLYLKGWKNVLFQSELSDCTWWQSKPTLYCSGSTMHQYAAEKFLIYPVNLQTQPYGRIQSKKLQPLIWKTALSTRARPI